jgi:SAM-dependent methyltransferase
LPYEDNSFDVITNAVSVDYLTKPLEVFREMHRVLKPGGQAIMSFSNRCFPTKGEPAALPLLIHAASLAGWTGALNLRNIPMSSMMHGGGLAVTWLAAQCTDLCCEASLRQHDRKGHSPPDVLQ